MAKKVLTPEEVQAKMEKKSAKRKIFFGTFTKALAFFLAIVMAYSLATIAFTPTTAPAAGGNVQSDAQTPGTQTPGTQTPGTQTPDTQTPDTQTPDTQTPGTQTPDTQTPNSPTENATTKAVELLNKVTAAAAKGSYNWTRVCAFTPDGKIDVGSATSTLNGIITQVDPNASLDTVVGGFLGIGNKEATVANGQFPQTGMSTEDYMLRGMGITAADVDGDVQVNGDVYTFNIKSCNNPKKTNNNALYRVTNDFFTHEEVESGLKSQLGSLSSLLSLKSSNVDYTKIKVVATIKNEKLTNLVISYEFAAELKLQATLIPITGKGKATNTMTYSNIAY